jgi:hypothetical protein
LEEALLLQPVGDIVGRFGLLLLAVKGQLAPRGSDRLGDDFSTSPDFFSSLLDLPVMRERRFSHELDEGVPRFLLGSFDLIPDAAEACSRSLPTGEAGLGMQRQLVDHEGRDHVGLSSFG